MPSAGILVDFVKDLNNNRYEFGKYSAVRTEHSVGIDFFHLIFGKIQNCPTQGLCLSKNKCPVL